MGCVTLGLETDFPEDDRNTDPGVANVLSGISYEIHGATQTGTGLIAMMGGGSGINITTRMSGGTVLGPAA